MSGEITQRKGESPQASKSLGMIKHCNICIIGIPEEERIEQKKLWNIWRNNFPKMLDIKPHIQET